MPQVRPRTVALLAVLCISGVTSFCIYRENYAGAVFNFCILQLLLVLMFEIMRLEAEEKELQRVRLLIQLEALNRK